MKTIAFAAAFAAISLAASASQATVLTFDGDICNGGTSCGSSETIDQTYGDGVGVDVTTSNGGGGPLQWWNLNYSDLTNVAWGQQTNDGATIFIAALSGYSVTLNGLDLGAWPNADADTNLTIREIGGGVLAPTATYTIDGVVHSHFTYNLTSTSGFEINFTNAYYVGIDNLDFTVTGGVVPEPGTWALMIAGFGLAGGALRRRKAAIA